MPNSGVQSAAPEFFVCIRRNPVRPGPAAYPVVKHPDGQIEKVTWAEFHASRNVSNN